MLLRNAVRVGRFTTHVDVSEHDDGSGSWPGKHFCALDKGVDLQSPSRILQLEERKRITWCEARRVREESDVGRSSHAGRRTADD